MKVKDPEQKFTFGKYKDKTVGWVLYNDPSYLYWCHIHISWFDIEHEAILKEARNAWERQEAERYIDYIDPYDFCF